jgi:D-threo-aldose 1-dehydrogenase
MRTRALRNGVALTELGLGTAQFGNLYRETTDEEAIGAAEAAWDAGVRYFDTAPHYGLGLSERRLGSYLATKPRDAFVLSSKVGRLLVPSPETSFEQDGEGFAVAATARRVWDFSREGILRSVDATLERMGLDHIDIAYLHDPDDHLEQAFGDGVETLIELRAQGVVRAVGAGMNQSAALAELIRRADVDVVMVAGRFSLLDQEAAETLLPLAAERRVGVVVAGVYNSGLLASPRPAPNGKYDYQDAPVHLVERARAIAEVCERHGVTLPEAAVAFPLLNPVVVSVVVGARTAAQVDGNVARYAARIPDALWSDLRSAALLPSAAIPFSRQDLT